MKLYRCDRCRAESASADAWETVTLTQIRSDAIASYPLAPCVLGDLCATCVGVLNDWMIVTPAEEAP